MRHFLAILVAVLLFSQSSVFAETKEIISEGTYNMGDGETPTVAESRGGTGFQPVNTGNMPVPLIFK